MIVVCKGVGDYAQLGSTLDDALGEVIPLCHECTFVS